jgi:hypothetical protein
MAISSHAPAPGRRELWGLGHERRDRWAGSTIGVLEKLPDGPTELLDTRDFPDEAAGRAEKRKPFRRSAGRVLGIIAVIASYGGSPDNARERGVIGTVESLTP